MTTQPIQRRRRVVDVEVLTPVVEGVPGHVAAIQLRITNLDTVIRSYDVSVLGFDPSSVTLTPAVVDLFPDEQTVATVRIDLPEDHAAGRHAISIQVTRPDDVPVVVDAVVEIEAREGLQLTTEPASLEMGSKGTFLIHLINTGNTGLPVELLAQDPERLVDVTFDPPAPVVPPGARSVVQATATGPRPWFGTPAVRVLDVTVRSGQTEAFGAVAVIQSPRISRRLIAFLGLLAMISMFALVITLSFSRVAALTERNEALVQQGLRGDDPAGERVAPTAVQGTVTSSTGGPIRGAVIVELYEQDNPLRPFQTTVTDAEGAYRFAAVPQGDYLIRTVAAGFGALWHPGVLDLANAEPITVEEGAGVAGLEAVLRGQPGGVSGLVLGADVSGAVLTVQLPAEIIEGSEFDPVPAVVQEIELDATGRFELGGLSTPAQYEILVTKPGFADERRTITLDAGEVREDIEILLGRGVGVIRGSVVNSAGDPLGGVDITATDGTTETRTRSLGGTDDTGTFELRNLEVPTTWTLTFTAPGFFTETRTIQVTGDDPPEERIVMTADGGSLGGLVRAADGTGIGNATVVVSGADLERTTWTLSVGEVGRWFVGDLPAPGTYTVSVSGPGFVTNAVSVELAAGAAANRSNVNVLLAPALVSVRGLVTDLDGAPISGVAVTLEGTGVQRSTVTSDDPAGAYVLDRLPAGVYTLTYRRAGSTVQTLLVDLPAGTDRTLDDVRLEQQAAITGVVRQSGVGQSDVGVLVYRADEYPGDVEASTITGTGGTFTIEGLDAPESYIIEFRVPAGGPAATSRTVELRPGETVELEVNL